MEYIDWNGWRLHFEITDYQAGSNGYYSGPWENSEPGYGPELEYRIFSIEAISPNGKPVFDIGEEDIDNLIWDFVEKQQED